ncbi:MAG: hypothetical protein FWE24_00555 [Defluviitaleaceae bacterium]|nr:hypothetical protein [Defluviitaleaceae bacterium]
MKQFQIELDEMVCRWLEHIAETTGQSIENVISNGIYQQIANLEETAMKAFTYRE